MHMYICSLLSKPQVWPHRSDPRLAEPAVGGWTVWYHLIRKILAKRDFGIFRGPESNLLIIPRDNCTYKMLLLLSHFICVALLLTPWIVAHQAPLSMGFSKREPEWAAVLSSRGSFWPRDWTHVSYVSCTSRRFFTTKLPGKPTKYLKLCGFLLVCLFLN